MADLHDDPDLPAGERYTHPFPSPGGFETAQAGLPIPPLPDGTRIWPYVPRYEIVEQLGRGGMGVVYKARQLGLNRTVALKMVLHGELAGEEELRRFRAEAEVVAHLQHPNIVQVYEVGEVGGQPFFSQEFIDGGSLAERLTAGPWVGRAAAELIETLARAIHVAHERGLVHRDLKPANILLTRDGVPKIADFGLAKRLQQEAGQTQTGHILGSPSYMAPEQASGLVRATRPATDVYALGAILYELLTGRPPFLAATMLDTLEQVRHHDPVPPRQLLPTVPRDLETICLKCLDKTQDRRFATAEQLADELRRFLRGEPIRSRPLSPWHRAAKWVRRQPAIAALSALVLLITALGIAGILWQWRLAERHRQTAEARATGEIAAGVAREAALALARRHLYFHQVGLADRDWGKNELDSARRFLAATPPALRHWEHDLLRWRCGAQLLEIATPSYGVAFSPDGKWIATGNGDRVFVWDEAGRLVRQLAWPEAGNTAIYQVRFSPDGRRLAAGGSCRHVPVWDTATWQLVHRLGPHVDRVHRLAFSPDGGRLVCGSGSRERGAAVVWDLPAGTRRHTFTDHKDAVDFVAYSPDGKRIATAGWDSRVFVYDAATGQSLRMLTGHVHDIAFAPDSRHLATAGVNQTIQIWDVDKGAVVSTLTGHTDEVGALAFDGHARLASAGMDTAIRVWDWRTGELLHVIRGAGYRVQQLAFSPGGDRLASSGPSVRVWNPDADQDARRIARFTDRFALAPDGRVLATVTAETHAVTLWDTRTGLPRFTLPGTSARPPALAFAAGGTVLAVASFGGDVQLVDPADGRIRHTLRHAGVRLVAFHPDGHTLATVAQRKKESELRLWEVVDGKPRQRWPLGVTGLRSLGFADGGRLLVVGGRSGDTGRLLVVDSATGEVVRQRDGDAWEGLACDPGGPRLALASLTGETTIRDTESGTAALTVPTAARAVAFSPDGQRLATANRAITLWESASGLESLTLTVPRRALTDCYFTDMTRRTYGVFFTQVEVATGAVAGRTCEGSVWLWTPHTPPPRPVRTTVLPIDRLPPGEVPDAALAAYGIRVGGMGKMMRHEPSASVHLPLGLPAFLSGTSPPLRETRMLTFDQPVRGVALTVAGLQGGASIAIWRLEALDSAGRLLAATGEPEYSKDPLPRTYRLRAEGIAAVRWVTDNRGVGDQAWATFTSPPVVEIVLER